MNRSVRTAALAALPLVTATVLALSPPASADDSDRVLDPAGDVRATTATAAQVDTVDLRKVTYVVAGRNLTITSTVVDLAATPGNLFFETEVGTGGSTFTLSSEMGRSVVKIAGSGLFYSCKGSSTTFDLRGDRVTQIVPVRCLDADLVRLKSSVVLAKNNGTPIARDGARRSGDINLK